MYFTLSQPSRHKLDHIPAVTPTVEDAKRLFLPAGTFALVSEWPDGSTAVWPNRQWSYRWTGKRWKLIDQTIGK